MSRFLIVFKGILVVVLQITLASLLQVQTVRPDFVVIFIVGRALLEGATVGVIWGFSLGFLLDAVSAGPIGLGSLAYSLAGFVAGQMGAGKVITRLTYLLAVAAAATAAYFTLLYFSEPWKEVGLLAPILQRTLPGILYTCVLGYIWTLTPFLRFGLERKRV